jgi:hypothetical protein
MIMEGKAQCLANDNADYEQRTTGDRQEAYQEETSKEL